MVLGGAAAYVACLFLPWYRETRFRDIDAMLGWVGPNAQATYVSLVVLAVLVVEVWRGRNRPDRDGTATSPRSERTSDLPRRGVVLLGLGITMVLLVLFRLLAQPEGVYWGLFGGLAAASVIAYGTHVIEYAESRRSEGAT